MSEDAIQLSVILVEELFGEIPSRVFGALAFHGRLPFRGLVHRTQISPTEIRHGLAVLIQQQLVQWYDPENSGQAFYEADIHNSFTLARSCKYSGLVKERFGDLASDILSNLIVLGYARVGDLTRTYFPPPGGRGPLHEIIPVEPPLELNGTKPTQLPGSVQDNAPSVELFRSTISDLLRAGLLSLVHESHFRPAADNVFEAELLVPRDGHISLKKPQQAAWEAAILKKLDEWTYGVEATTDNLALPQKGKKRALEDGDEQLGNKKRKLMNQQPSGANGAAGNPFSGESGWLDDELIVRVNHEKSAILLRNRQLVALAEESISSSSAKVYGEVLRDAEPQLKKCKTELDVDVEDDENAVT
ncbi:MAG: hypothetical protein L6R39_005025 [Caloplaca ligustica]|nr:MAG: hypothetical protein L6R39_005025 [Caloplaca ligustica]